MRNLVVIEYSSLDGVIQAPGHTAEDRAGGFAHGGWTAPLMEQHGRYNSASFQTAGAFLLGRRTYEIWAPYWPTVTDPDDLIAQALNTLPKYVASRTLTRADWPETTIIRDVPRGVAALKNEPGKPIFVLGSADLAQTLIGHGLVDEYQLWLHPVVLGLGKRLFRETTRRLDLALVDSRTAVGGLVILTYVPTAGAATTRGGEATGAAPSS
jgi:dihydrofolate reductase